jgi:type II secretory pathway pseudopilin PulG
MKVWPTNVIAKSRQRGAEPIEHGDAGFCSETQPATAGFTMVEIALCLGIIGFALVAIIGILPSGMNVQKDNREETIIKEDATYLINAIRGGARTNDLIDYVESLTISNSASGTITYTQTQLQQMQTRRNVTNSIIIGLLSTPKYFPADNVINRVTANMFAISGSAIEKPPSTARDVAFKYQLTCEVVPIRTISTDLYRGNDPRLTPEERNVRSNLLAQTREQLVNLYDLRLMFRWPILANGTIGRNKLVFRTTASGRLEFLDHNDPTGFAPFDGRYDEKRRYYYFAPTSAFTKAP